MVRRVPVQAGAEDWLVQSWQKAVSWSVGTIFGIIGILSCFYFVNPASVGVVKRFGAYSRTTQPGAHLKLPYGIERVIKVPVREVQKEEFGFRTLKAGVRSEYLGAESLARASNSDLLNFINSSAEKIESADPKIAAKEILRKEYLTLTGDLNMVDIEWIVQYKIKDPLAYAFNVRNQRKIIRDLSEAVMRTIAGDSSVDEVLTIGRIDIENEAKERLQALLDAYGTGIDIVTLKLQGANPPEAVRPAFNEVNEAMQQKEKRISEAMQEYNKEIPAARGAAEKLVSEARGYKAERINRALGDAGRFEAVLKEYWKAPNVTRLRLRLEAREEILKKVKEIYAIEQKGAEGGLLLLKRLIEEGEVK